MKTTRPKALFGATALVGAMVWAAAASAQQADPGAGQTPTGTDPEAQSTGLDDIVVTATRRSQRLQDVPIAVTALSGETLQNTGVSQTAQLAQVTPGLVLGRNTAQFQPTIRGIGSRAATAGDESNVAIYVDGIYQPEIFAGAFDFLEVQRIEVLRGPQGTLFGRNSTGGLINVITPDPTFDLYGNVSARYGRFDERSVKGYVSGPLTDRLAYSLAGLAYEDDGYVHDLVQGGNAGDKRTYAFRGKLLYEISDDTRAVLTVNVGDQHDSAPVVPTPINGNTVGATSRPLASRPFETALSLDPYSEVSQHGAALRITSERDALDLEVTGSYQRNRLNQLSDSDASVANVSSFENHTRSEIWTGEVKASSKPESPIQWTAGLFGFNGVAELVPSRVRGTNGVVSSTNFARNETNSLAAYAEGVFPLTERLRLTAGARYSWEERHFEDVFTTAAGVVTTVDAETSFNRVTPRAVLQYQLSEDAQIYASYSKGFKSGVFNTGGPNPLPVAPEEVDAFEVGLKSDPLPWLRVNLSAFMYDYDDIQVSVRNPAGISTLQNAATAEMRGGEAEVTAVFGDLNVRFAAAYLDAEYTDFPNAIITVPRVGGGNTQVSADVSGNRALRSPELTLNLGLDYSRTLSVGTLSASGNVYYSDDYFWDFANRLGQESYVLVNARINWDLPGDQWRLSVYGENLTDTEVASNVVSSTLGDYATYQKPRTYGVEARWSF